MATDRTAAEAEQHYFEGMSAERRKVIAPLVIFVCVVYFVLPLITNFTSLLDGTPFEGMSWAYLYAFGVFLVVLIITMYYSRRMDAVEQRLRPRDAVEVAADYEHWDER